MKVSVIIPVFNGGPVFRETLASVLREAAADEVLVVSDASTDGSDRVAEDLGAKVLRVPENAGPSRARNLGARAATGELLVFVDADVSLPPGVIGRMRGLFEGPEAPDAAFGSYDDAPACPGFAAQYRNLLHHHVHQTGRPEAVTFWAGFGAVRTEVFLRLGGFDEARRWLEDVDLGARLIAAGGRIRLDRSLQVKHHKAWTLGAMLWTDVAYRAYPWSELIWKHGRMPKDLNLRSSSRWAAILVLSFPLWAAGVAGLDGPWRWAALAGLAGSIALQAALDASLYGLFLRTRGVGFLLRAVPCHWAYYVSAALTYAASTTAFALTGRPRGARPPPAAARPLPSFGVAIAGYNEAQNLGRLLDVLESGWSEGFRPGKTVVAVEGSTDGSEAIARGHASGATVLGGAERRGKPAALNRMIRELEGVEVIVLISADVLPEPGCLRRLLEAFRDPGVGVAGGRPVPEPGPSDAAVLLTGLLWDLHHRMASTSPKTSEVTAFRNRGQQIDEGSWADEAELEGQLLKSGYRVVYVPEARIRTQGARRMADYVRQRIRVTRGHLDVRERLGYRVGSLSWGRRVAAAWGIVLESPERLALLAAGALVELGIALTARRGRRRGGAWARIGSAKASFRSGCRGNMGGPRL